MQKVDETFWDIWEAGDFTGDNRPVTRAIISKDTIKKRGSYSFPDLEGTTYRTLLFDQDGLHNEIPNIVSCTIDRRLNADAATMTLQIRNDLPVDINANLDLTTDGEDKYDYIFDESGRPGGPVLPTKRELHEFSTPGYYTYNRGAAFDSLWRWGQTSNAWADIFIPNRVIRTYQGYGTDGAGFPWQDEKLTQTGTWLIDTVNYRADGLINIECRDLAKLLIEQRLYPPIIPLGDYPLDLCGPKVETITKKVVEEGTKEQVGDNVAKHQTNGGWDSGNVPYFGFNGSVYGHRPSHAFDGDESTYWLSMRNNGPNEVWSFEWIEANCGAEFVNQVKMKLKWGNYKIYIAVWEGEGDPQPGTTDNFWQGTNYVPYGYDSAPAAPNGSYVPYVLETTAPAGDGWFTIDLPRTYRADAVRVIFTNLQNYGVISGGDYRAAVYELECRSYTAGGGTTEREVTEEITVEGNIKDYTDIIKLFCAWSGFYWPDGTPGDEVLERFGSAGAGRVWGDFFYSGAYPVEPPCIPASYWDNKSVMDGINQIREILGFVFYVDSQGGVIWRPPNIWQTGNYLLGEGYVGEDSVRVVDENKVLLDYGVTVSDEALRSSISVVSAQDPTLRGSYTPGFAEEGTPNYLSDLALLGGQERIMLVPNYPFVSQEEVNKFGFLVSLWMHWAMRKSKFRIPGMPALEPDDQLRIYEKVTSETFVHYVEGVSSVMNMDSGSWVMDVDTHWLGDGPNSTWHVSMAEMDPALYAYLVGAGAINPDTSGEAPPEIEAILNWTPPEIPSDPIRVPEDWEINFPWPADVIWTPPNADPEDGSLPGDWITEPTAGSGGSGWGCGANTQFANWGSGPYRRDGTGKCDTSDWVTKTMVRKWHPDYGASSPYSNPNQLETLQTVFDRRGLQAWKAAIAIFMDEDVYITHMSGAVCRTIKGSTTWSNHAWGLAIDFNSDLYRWGRSITEYGGAQAAAFARACSRIESTVYCINGSRIFKWGEHFSKKDPMHLQICCAPADLATGITFKL